jgi:hypothetical protein
MNDIYWLFKRNIDRGPETYTICIWQQPLHHSDNTDGSTRQATGTDNHCLGTCPIAAPVSLYPPLDEPLFHCLTNRLFGIEPPALQSFLQWSKHMIVTWGEIGAVRGVIQNTPAKTAQGVPCCVGSMCACHSRHHVAAPSTIGIVAAFVYVSLEQPLYKHIGR